MYPRHADIQDPQKEVFSENEKYLIKKAYRQVLLRSPNKSKRSSQLKNWMHKVIIWLTFFLAVPWSVKLIRIRPNYRAARNLKQKLTASMGEYGPVHTFVWAKTILTSKYPEVASQALRYEADGDFFQSLFLISLILVIPAFFFSFTIGIIALAFSFLFLVCYVRQRHKASEMIYDSILSLWSIKE